MGEISFMEMGMIAAILAATEVIKSFDVNNKLWRFYPVIPLVLGIIAAFATADTLTFQKVLEKTILYVGPATYIFKFGKTTLLGK